MSKITTEWIESYGDCTTRYRIKKGRDNIGYATYISDWRGKRFVLENLKYLHSKYKRFLDKLERRCIVEYI